ncbi:hypothetical protein TRFO_26867 [Tritrichomonas foetus]|uniref:Lecithin:cholesterol acyltransferase family protein n=1 Tax=Tritrichomonas foetus TaxID=1144522 RepID=A0A1J4K393_9EUKA|nr:hypothetical protein TRFO_26867 [Tritrichomonas foetus]|eukprot:OHT05442.1 hypothetical protein TRFO_26867 [Tritrichomonas foetus]
MFLFIGLVACVKPVFFIPCLCGPRLYANITEPDLHSECPEMNNYQFWPIDGQLQSKYPDCYGKLMNTKYDETTRRVSPLQGITITSEPFGDYESQYSFVPLANELKKQGYQKNVNLFGALYDFIHYPLGLDDFLNILIQKIEEAYKVNSEKAVLIGQSLGTHFVYMILTKWTTKQWREKYIDRAIFVAPAFLGCFNPFDEFVQGWFSNLKVTPGVTESARRMTACQVLATNYVVGENSIVFKNSEDPSKSVKAPEIRQYLIQNKVLTDDNIKIFDEIETILKEYPTEPDVPSLVIYNSGIDTKVAFDATEGIDKLKYIYGKGDETCQSEGAEWVCDHWSNVKCFDAKSSSQTYEHISMLFASDNIQRMIRFIDNNNVKKPRRPKIF